MVLVLMGLTVRADLAGVTSLVRSLGLLPSDYKRLLHLFHSSGLDLERLTELWTAWCGEAFPAQPFQGKFSLNLLYIPPQMGVVECCWGEFSSGSRQRVRSV